MLAAFLEAAIPEPFACLGRRLKPFTLGHDLIFERFGSRYAMGCRETPEWEDLLFSVYVCSYSFRDALDRICSPSVTKELKKWGKACAKDKNFDLAEEFRSFHRYLSNYTKEPEFWIESDGKGQPSGIPFTQFIKVKMMQEFGMSEDAALEMPYNMAVMNYLTVLEGKGVIRFFTDTDRQLLKASKDPKMQAKLDAMAKRLAKN